MSKTDDGAYYPEMTNVLARSHVVEKAILPPRLRIKSLEKSYGARLVRKITFKWIATVTKLMFITLIVNLL